MRSAHGSYPELGISACTPQVLGGDFTPSPSAPPTTVVRGLQSSPLNGCAPADGHRGADEATRGRGRQWRARHPIACLALSDRWDTTMELTLGPLRKAVPGGVSRMRSRPKSGACPNQDAPGGEWDRFRARYTSQALVESTSTVKSPPGSRHGRAGRRG